jgi:hypothetical protein
MNSENYVLLAELVASIAVVVSLIYLAIQVRQSTKVNSAAARHAISDFALQFSMFNAEHADRLAKVLSEAELDEGDLMFRWWSHMMVFLHAETYYRHHELGLMPASHWNGYVRYVTGYLESPGVPEFWDDVGPAFSADFSAWITGLLAEQTGDPGAARPS